MGGGPSNMQGMIKQAQKMQEDMARIQEELAATTYTATVGGGMVTATVDGSHELKELTIQPDAVDPDDVEMLTDLVMAAVNEAIRKAAADSEEKMGAVTGGMSLPGLF
jgi:DNA-binding YbaB/EbfC family protein